MKKILCFILAVVYLFTLTPYVFASNDYSGHWAADTVESLISKEIISKDADGNVKPEDFIKRCEFVKIINRTFGFTNISEQNFPDIDENMWYSNEFKIAKNEGYITGDESGNANPEASLTRFEAAVILARVLKLETEEDDTVSFSDEIPKWAISSVSVLSQNGIFTGYEDNTFRGGNSIKRGEAFTLVKRIIDLNEDKDEEPKEEVKEEIKEETTETKPENNMGDVSGMHQTPSAPSVSSGGGGGGGGGGNIKSTGYKTVE